MVSEILYSLLWRFAHKRALRHAQEHASYMATRCAGWRVEIAVALENRARRSAALLADLNSYR